MLERPATTCVTYITSAYSLMNAVQAALTSGLVLGMVAESVEHVPRRWEIVGSNPARHYYNMV